MAGNLSPGWSVAAVDHALLQSPVGELHLFGSANGLLTITLPNETRESGEARIRRRFARERLQVEFREDESSLLHPLRQISAYFEGSRRTFDLKLDHGGTQFQSSVWEALAAIPSGETRSYADIAVIIGKPAATRAVGAANGANPLPIVVPCHRVIGSNGTLTGYGGGLPLKERLLAWERGTFATW